MLVIQYHNDIHENIPKRHQEINEVCIKQAVEIVKQKVFYVFLKKSILSASPTSMLIYGNI